MTKKVVAGILALICFVAVFPAITAASVSAQRIEVPLEWQGKTLELDAMIYKPPGGWSVSRHGHDAWHVA